MGCFELNRISKKINKDYKTVSKWRRNFFENIPILAEIESEHDITEEENKQESLETKLTEQIKIILSDAERPGAPCKFTEVQILQIIAIACENPQNSGREINEWSLNAIKDEAIKRGIVEDISAKSVSRFLKSG